MTELSPYSYINPLDEIGVNRDYSHDFDIRKVSTYEIHEDRIKISDERWGDVTIGYEEGDEVFLALAAHPAIRRLHSIAQLTLPMQLETIPGIYTNDGSDGYTRWHHAFGSLAFVRTKGHELGLEPRELRRLELITFLSDVTQWVGSHLGDFMFQGFGGAENAHDIGQKEILEALEFDEFLNHFGYSLDDVLLESLPEGYDWIESDSPQLCTDRVDYTARQIARHLNFSMDTEMATRPEAFIVDSKTGLLVMRNESLARAFTKAALIMSTEHFQEPVHRLNLIWFSEVVKNALANEYPLMMHPLAEEQRYNPKDYMLSVDADILTSLRNTNPYIRTLLELMQSNARQRREIYKTIRAPELSEFMNNDDADRIPDPIESLSWRAVSYSLFPSNVEIHIVDPEELLPDMYMHPNAIDVPLPPLKHRWINPHYYDSEGNIVQFTDESIVGKLIKHQGEILQRTYVARVFVNEEFKHHLELGKRETDLRWAEAMTLPRMEPDVFKECFEWASSYGVPHRQAHILWAR